MRSEADQLNAAALLLTKHQELKKTDYDPNGLVHDRLKTARFRTIQEYDVAMSNTATELESANFLHEKMYEKPTKLLKDQEPLKTQTQTVLSPPRSTPHSSQRPPPTGPWIA